jgi:hypothetical protein
MRRCFEVEKAGCPSCAERVRDALSALGTVDEIIIDEREDRARIVLSALTELRDETVNEALARASRGSGHEYRILAGSWRDGI